MSLKSLLFIQIQHDGEGDEWWKLTVMVGKALRRGTAGTKNEKFMLYSNKKFMLNSNKMYALHPNMQLHK